MRLKPIHIIIIYLPALLLDYAFSSVLTNSSFYTSYLNLSSSFLGLIDGITLAIYALLAVPMGKLSDRVNRTQMLYVGCLLLAGVSFALPYCNQKLHLLLIFPIIGVSMSLFWPAYEAWLAEREGEGQLLHRVMLFNLFWSTGITLGPTLSSYLYNEINPFRPFYLSSIIGLISIVVLYVSKFKPKPELTSINPEPTPPGLPSPTVRRIYLNLSRCANFSSYFVLGVLRLLAPKLTIEMGIASVVFGNMMLALGGIQTLTFLLLGTKFSTRLHFRLNPIIIVQIFTTICLLGVWYIQHTLFWICAFLIIGISTAITYFSSLYYGLYQHEDKGNKSGWHEAFLAFGSLLGPLLGGVVADTVLGPKSPYLLCAIVIGISIVLQLFIARRINLVEDEL
ncbi:hypothetical protein C6497_04995 [Candidatus Poribacteria bacterium]|nr:MAG: hypothetical protein C6497_04995 [Candidatus Poribacteria bacterium]